MDILKVVYSAKEPDTTAAKYILWVKPIEGGDLKIFKLENGEWYAVSAVLQGIIESSKVEHRNVSLELIIDKVIQELSNLDTAVKAVEKTLSDLDKIYVTTIQ